ncbi:MAG: lasso peptide biosynthesis B2 protein [Gammaproteobacteria bacterium]|nr:lasso peptide biosynthesis B2 protein [Gammaproteobacteria bacterium]
MRSNDSARLPVAEKVRLFVRIWALAVQSATASKRCALPDLMESYRIGSTARSHPTYAPRKLSTAVTRSLRVGPWQPRCLIKAMVLYRLMREQGEEAELVIGLPQNPKDHTAHAWVEAHGVDIGPAPGRGHHQELARYG